MDYSIRIVRNGKRKFDHLANIRTCMLSYLCMLVFFTGTGVHNALCVFPVPAMTPDTTTG